MSEWSAETVQVFAECINRGEYPEVEFGDATETSLWCNVCLDHTRITWPLKVITPEGVHDAGTVTACPQHEEFKIDE